SAAILHDDPSEMIDSGRRVPLELERVIRRCLEKNPEARFQSARDLAFALRSIQTSGDVPISAFAPPGSASPRVRPLLWVAAGGGLVLLAAGTFYMLTRPGPAAQVDKTAEDGQIRAVAVLPF